MNKTKWEKHGILPDPNPYGKWVSIKNHNRVVKEAVEILLQELMVEVEGKISEVENEWKKSVENIWNSNHDYSCSMGDKCTHHIKWENITFDPASNTLYKRPEYKYINDGYKRGVNLVLSLIKSKRRG